MVNSDPSFTDESLKKLSTYKVNTLKCDAGTFSGSGLKYLQKPSLRFISMLYSQLDDERLHYLTQFQNLNTVKVGSDLISDQGVVYLTRLKDISNIKVVSKNITGQVVDSLIEMPLLQQVSISSPNLDLPFFEGLCKIKKLRDLEVGGTPISDEDFKSIARIKSLHKLRLGQSEFAPESLRHLANHPGLDTLDFSNSQNISEELIEYLIPLKVEQLFLDKSNLTDAHLLKLSKMRHLRFVRLTGCHFSDEALDAFESNFQTMWKRKCDYDASIVN